MADLSVTADSVEVIFPRLAVIFPGVAAEAVTQGQSLYLKSDGRWGLSSTSTAGKQQARGIALNPAGANGHLDILKEGHVSGIDVSAKTLDAQIFASDTLGALADAAGTKSVPVGRVVPMSDRPTYTQALYVRFDWVTQF